MDSQNSPEPQGHGRWDTVSLPLLRKRGLQMQIQRATQSDVVGVVPSTIHDPATPSSVSHSRISFEQFRYTGSKANNVQNGSADSGDRRASSAASSSYFSANSRRQHEVQSSRMEAPRFSEVTSEGRGLAHVVIALAEGRGNAHGEVGLSVIDLRTSVVSLGQYADSASYMKTICKLNALEPSVLIIPETMTAPQNLQPLYTILREFHYQGGPSIVTVQRRLYSEAAGMDLVKKLNLSFDGKLEMELTSKYYCLASLAALITYVESERKLILMPQTLRIEYMQMEDTCLIDVSTSKSLELISNATHQQLANKCLLGVLDHTKTYAGGRLLRANLLQPFTKLLTIQMRLECIQEMVRTEDLYFGLQQLLSRFTDVEKAIAFLVQTPTKESAKVSESYIGSIIHLKHILSLVEPLRDLLTGSHSELLRGFQQMLNDGRFDDMRNIIEVLVHPEAKFEKGSLRMKTQKCYAVRPKINGCLDVARLLYAESVDDISGYKTEFDQNLAPSKRT
ncbi:hypothetical protein RvY_07994-2 [Ramazzottius varieornatus]|uniref:DNA mismatch repair protein MutS core domain-containing protein n=1 Tax=Ramazzottius varieornatus TaxID=947166 RepID=A0A1D1V716_RAMVA|nr:hypothetical protein RvY_07994-2 [Ramazzottius varieornatus]